MWPDRLKTTDLVTFTEDILNEKLHFLSNIFFSSFKAKLKIRNQLDFRGVLRTLSKI